MLYLGEVSLLQQHRGWCTMREASGVALHLSCTLRNQPGMFHVSTNFSIIGNRLLGARTLFSFMPCKFCFSSFCSRLNASHPKMVCCGFDYSVNSLATQIFPFYAGICWNYSEHSTFVWDGNSVGPILDSSTRQGRVSARRSTLLFLHGLVAVSTFLSKERRNSCLTRKLLFSHKLSLTYHTYVS